MLASDDLPTLGDTFSRITAAGLSSHAATVDSSIGCGVWATLLCGELVGSVALVG